MMKHASRLPMICCRRFRLYGSRSRETSGTELSRVRLQPFANCGRVLAAFVTAVLMAFGFISVVQAAENPTSYGKVAKIDTPILRIPLTKTPPTIDGVMDEGEWEDSAALSGFWYDFATAHFVFMAPMQTQLQVYAAYDKEKLYIAYSSPVYPENSWLRSRGRFPDVTNHPQYGLIWADHIELELRPYENNAEAFRLGLFKWFVNPFDTTADLYWSINHGERHQWQSKSCFSSDSPLSPK